jgi:transposase InsO family protein
MAAARLQRWAIKLAAYTYDIEFRRTTDHSNADGLSRLPLPTCNPDNSSLQSSVLNIHQIETLPVTATKIARATRQDRILNKVYQFITKGWPLSLDHSFKPYIHRKNELSVEDGCIVWGTRVVIPTKYRHDLLKELHDSHPGICKMKGIARSYLWWPSLDKDIEHVAKGCMECRAVKGTPQTAPLHPWVWPSRPYHRIRLDFAGPFQGAMFLVAIDAYSKWPDVFIMQGTTVNKTIEKLRQVFAMHGIPEQIVSDNGPQFTSEEFATFLLENGVKHIRSAPYHPATNGLAERFIQSMKQALIASKQNGSTLSHRLSNFLFKYRSSPHTTTGTSPSLLLQKREIRTRFDLLRPDRRSRVAERQQQQKVDHNRNKRVRSFSVGQSVMVKNFRPGPDWIPATIVEKLGPLSYVIETQDLQLWRRHVDHVKGREDLDVNQSQPNEVWDFTQTTEQEIVTANEEQLETNTSPQLQPEEPELNEVLNEPTTPSQIVPQQSQEHRYPQRQRKTPVFYRPGSYL